MRVLSPRAECAPAAAALVAAIAFSAGPAAATVVGTDAAAGVKTAVNTGAGTSTRASAAPAAAWALSGPGVWSPANPAGFGALATTRSTNWSGYAAATGTYTSVSASWVQPAVTCGESSEAVFWVGLDGWGSDTVEQDGSGAYCSGSTPHYYAWWETYPVNAIQQYNKTVKAGDHFTATVTYKGGGKYLMTVVDSTQGWTENTNATSSSATRSSAEVIAEAPSGSGGREALADFGKVAFTGSMVDGTAISNSSPMALNMYSGGLDASTSKLSGTENFKVTWKNY